MAANVPRNLRYDQQSQTTLAETLISKQAPEGRVNSFTADQKIDFRFPTAGGYVDSFASSTLDFDLDIYNSDGLANHNVGFDPWLGAHQLIQRLVVTVGSNIIEDTNQYPMAVKEMKALHGHEEKLQLDKALSEECSCLMTSYTAGTKPDLADNASEAHIIAAFQNLTLATGSDEYGKPMRYWAVKVSAGKVQRYKIRLNLMSCLGSLSGAKYWPSTLLNSDIRLEIYLNRQLQGMILASDAVTWTLNNVEFNLTRVRLNTTVIDALKSSATAAGGLKMIMPGFTHYQETVGPVPATVGSTIAHYTKYASSATSLKSILCTFRNQAYIDKTNYNSYSFVDPNGLEYQFLIGSTLMPQRPVIAQVDKYKELMRCMGGPINSLTQQNLVSNRSFNVKDSASAYQLSGIPGCHIIGQSLEMYADHTLSSTIFSGITAINLVMQGQFRLTAGAVVTDLETVTNDKYSTLVQDNLVSKVGAVAGTNVSQTYYLDTILVFDRLLTFTGNGEVIMGY